MKVHVVCCLQNNFSYILVDEDNGIAACVDPVEPERILQAIGSLNVQLVAALCTHKHWDHSGGNIKLAESLPSIDIIGSAYEETPGITKTMRDMQKIELGSMSIQAFHVPCHTRGHLLFYVTSQTQPSTAPILFTGDTLFVGGCGKFFEGSAADMHFALCHRIANLPSETLVYCGHEYTVQNLRFALTIEPTNPATIAKYQQAIASQSANSPTVPSTIRDEMAYNPFMRVAEFSVKQSLADNPSMLDDVECMRRLRERKDNFK